MSNGNAAAGPGGKAAGGAAMLGSMDDTEGSVVVVGAAVEGGGIAAAPEPGVGLGSAIFAVASTFTRFGRGEFGSDGGICCFGVSIASFVAGSDIFVKVGWRLV